MRWNVAIVTHLFMGSGCSDPCAELLNVDSLVEIGTGWDTFMPIGEITGFEKGPQGGFHIYASLRASGVYGGNERNLGETMPFITYKIESADGLLTGGFERMLRPMESLNDGRIERLGDLAILSSYEPSEMEGVEVEIYAEIEDICGNKATATTQTVLSEGAF